MLEGREGVRRRERRFLSLLFVVVPFWDRHIKMGLLTNWKKPDSQTYVCARVSMSVCVCVCVCARARARACVRASV